MGVMEDDFLKGKRCKVYLRLRSFPCADGKEQQRKEQRSPPAPTHSGWLQPRHSHRIPGASTRRAGW